MNGILLRLRRSVRTTADHGASAVEYGLMIAAIAAVIVGTVFALGGYVKSAFDDTCTAINSRTTPGCETTP
jgi:pilus assembly protein Flp/PilA